MANTDIKKLLVRLNVSTENWKTALSDIRRNLEEGRKLDARAVEAQQAALDKQIDKIKESIDTVRQRTKEVEAQVKLETKLRENAEANIDRLRKEITTLKEKSREQQIQVKDQLKQMQQSDILIGKLKDTVAVQRQLTLEAQKQSAEIEKQGRWTDEARRQQSDMMKERYRLAQIAALPKNQVTPLGDVTPVLMTAEARTAYLARQAELAAKAEELRLQKQLAEQQRIEAEALRRKTWEIDQQNRKKERELVLQAAIQRENDPRRASIALGYAGAGPPVLTPSTYYTTDPNEKAFNEGIRGTQDTIEAFNAGMRNAGGGAGGGGGGILGMLGGGLGGNLIAGAVGGGIAVVADLVVSKLHNASHAITEFIQEAGPLLNVLNVFENVSEKAGISAEKFGDDLRNATQGLVDDAKIFQFASTVIRENTGLTAKEITNLVDVTSRFARVTGKDPVDALNMLNRSLQTGRLAMLGYQLGLDPATRDLLELTDGLERHERIATQVAIIQEEMQRQLKVTGEPVRSVTEIFKEFSTWLNDVYEKTVEYIGASSELNSFLLLLEELGHGVVNIFSLISETLGAVGLKSEATTESVGLLSTIFLGAAKGIAYFNAFLADTISKLQTGKEVLEAWWNDDSSTKAMERYNERNAKIQKDLDKQLERIEQIKHPGKKATEDNANEEKDIDLKTQQERIKLHLTAEKEAAEQELAIAKTLASKKKDLNEEAFKYGKEGLLDYVAAQKEAAKQEYEAERLKIQKLRSVELQQLDIEAYGSLANAKIAREHPEMVTKAGESLGPGQVRRFDDLEKQSAKRLEITTKTNTQLIELEDKYRKELKSYDDLILKDQFEASKRRVEIEVEAQKSILDIKQKGIEADYQLGKISKEELDVAKQQIILDKQKLEIKLAVNKLVNTPGWQQSEVAKQDFNAEVAKAGRAREQAEQELAISNEEMQRQVSQKGAETNIEVNKSALAATSKFYEYELENRRMTIEQVLDLRRDAIIKEGELEKQSAEIKKQYSVQSIATEEEYNDAILKINQSTANKLKEFDRGRADAILDYTNRIYGIEMKRLDARRAAGESEGAILQKQITLTEQYIQDLVEQASESGHLSEEEQKRLETLNETLGTLVRLKAAQYDFMGAVSDTQNILGDLFESMGANSDKGFGGLMKSLGTGLRSGASISSAVKDYLSNPIRVVTGMSENPFTGLFQSMGQLFNPTKDENGKAQRTSTERLNAFNTALQAVTATIGGIYQISQSKTPGQGLLSGAVTGASIGSMGGPIGAAIGAGVGAIYGFIVGAARKRTEDAAKRMTDAFNKVAQSFEAGNIQLKEAIRQMVEQRNTTVSTLSGKKGGREQLDQILPQVDQQIAQLKKQQKALTDQLDEELKVLSAPTELKDYVRDLTEIIKKYKDFEGALEDTSKAQEYLKLTLQDYINTQKNALTDANRTAIEDAIKLNDLIEQRTTLLSDEAKQEFDIRTAGVLTRQRTTAQTKMSQIEDLRTNLDKQLEQINKEIELTQFKVDQEKLIFNIASDRVALETELVSMQHQVILDDMNRIRALESMINALAKTGGSITGLQQLLSSVPKGSQLNTMLEGMYSNYGRNGYAGFNAEI